jgi:Domain of unknown function (DUF4386)
MNPLRTTAFVVGLLFIITFVVSIPAALVLYTPVLDHTDHIVGAGADSRVALGAFLEMTLIVANIGTAVVLFPILRSYVSCRNALSDSGSLVTVSMLKRGEESLNPFTMQ